LAAWRSASALAQKERWDKAEADRQAAKRAKQAQAEQAEREKAEANLQIAVVPLYFAAMRPVVERAIALHDRPHRGEIQRHDGDLLLVDVLPDVELGPVRKRKRAKAFALVLAQVVDAPELRA